MTSHRQLSTSSPPPAPSSGSVASASIRNHTHPSDNSACDQCYRLKIKCERSPPSNSHCIKCKENNSACTKSLGRRKPGKPKGSKNKSTRAKERYMVKNENTGTVSNSSTGIVNGGLGIHSHTDPNQQPLQSEATTSNSSSSALATSPNFQFADASSNNFTQDASSSLNQHHIFQQPTTNHSWIIASEPDSAQSFYQPYLNESHLNASTVTASHLSSNLQSSFSPNIQSNLTSNIACNVNPNSSLNSNLLDYHDLNISSSPTKQIPTKIACFCNPDTLGHVVGLRNSILSYSDLRPDIPLAKTQTGKEILLNCATCDTCSSTPATITISLELNHRLFSKLLLINTLLSVYDSFVSKRPHDILEGIWKFSSYPIPQNILSKTVSWYVREQLSDLKGIVDEMGQDTDSFEYLLQHIATLTEKTEYNAIITNQV